MSFRCVQVQISIHPRLFLQTIPLPVNKILEYSSPVSGVEQLSHLIGLLALHNDGQGNLDIGCLLSLHSGTNSGLQQGDMKSERKLWLGNASS